MKKTIIIAEAGVNHNGDFELARKMIDVAAAAGADYVKFQTAVPELVISRFAPKAEYQKETTGESESQLEMCRRIHLPLDAYKELAQLCRQKGIGFMSTPFDLRSIDVLADLDMDFWKIPSGEITNLPYLRKIASKGGRVIMSTGMSTLDEVEAAVKVLENGGICRNDIYLLHCTTQYPTPFEAVNLKAMDSLATLGCAGVGYSDHTLGITVPIAAVALGAEIIEKHFTLDCSMEGPDHRASLDPDRLKSMIKAIRETELALGVSEKIVTDAERPNIAIARKSIVAATEIFPGDEFTEHNLAVKRPGDGISPMMWDSVIGQRSKSHFMPDEQISL